LFALLQPYARLRTLQDSGNFSELLMVMEETKTLPFGDVWEEYCRRQNVPADDEEWFGGIMKYEKEVLAKRR
jgi:L-rhamnose isomerase